MRYYLDTEFIERGYRFPIDLISVGIVCDDGREYYGQLINANYLSADQWLFDNVYPHMYHCRNSDATIDAAIHTGMFISEGKDECLADPVGCPWKTREMMKADILAFIGADKKPQFWAWFGSYDWVVFCQLFGRMVDLPSNFPHMVHDLKQYQKQLRAGELPKQTGAEHNALNDARWVADAWAYLKGLDKNGR